jgi:hypothetical protein
MLAHTFGLYIHLITILDNHHHHPYATTTMTCHHFHYALKPLHFVPLPIRRSNEIRFSTLPSHQDIS